MRTLFFGRLGIGLCVFLVGTLIGGCLIAALPHHNNIHLTVTPYNAVNIVPEVGDTIDWTAYGQPIPPNISFPYTGSPCKMTGSSTCDYQPASPYDVYIYQCSGSVATCDPGFGPHSVTRVTETNVLEKIVVPTAHILDNVVLPIDGTLGILPEPTAPSAPQPVVPAASRTTAAAGPDITVGCLNNKTNANPQNLTKASGDTIFWAGPAFTIAFANPSACPGNMSSPAPFQSCTFTPPASTPSKTPFHYTVTDTSCTGQTYDAIITTP